MTHCAVPKLPSSRIFRPTDYPHETIRCWYMASIRAYCTRILAQVYAQRSSPTRSVVFAVRYLLVCATDGLVPCDIGSESYDGDAKPWEQVAEPAVNRESETQPRRRVSGSFDSSTVHPSTWVCDGSYDRTFDDWRRLGTACAVGRGSAPVRAALAELGGAHLAPGFTFCPGVCKIVQYAVMGQRAMFC